jgi:hypothetical protein
MIMKIIDHLRTACANNPGPFQIEVVKSPYRTSGVNRSALLCLVWQHDHGDVLRP